MGTVNYTSTVSSFGLQLSVVLTVHAFGKKILETLGHLVRVKGTLRNSNSNISSIWFEFSLGRCSIISLSKPLHVRVESYNSKVYSEERVGQRTPAQSFS